MELLIFVLVIAFCIILALVVGILFCLFLYFVAITWEIIKRWIEKMFMFLDGVLEKIKKDT